MLINDTQVAFATNPMPTAPSSVTGDVVVAPGTVLTAAVYTAAIALPGVFSAKGRGANITAVISANAGTGTLVFKVQGLDAASQTSVDVPGAAIVATSGNGTTNLQIHPDLTAAANVIAKQVMPDTFRLAATVGGTSVTCSIGVNYLA